MPCAPCRQTIYIFQAKAEKQGSNIRWFQADKPSNIIVPDTRFGYLTISTLNVWQCQNKPAQNKKTNEFL